MDNLEIRPSILLKINNEHNVIEAEVHQCFYNITSGALIDDREEHKTNPPTHWFVAETDEGRVLKVIFIYHKDSSKYVLKSAYDANPTVIALYNKLTRAN